MAGAKGSVEEAAARAKRRREQLSASQIKSFLQCRRRWGLHYLDGIEEPANKYAAFGLEMHGHLERWLRDGVPPPQSELSGQIALAGLHHWPPPGKSLGVEREILTRSPSSAYYGVQDVELIDMKTGLSVVGDHKSTSSFSWALTDERVLRRGVREYGRDDKRLIADVQAAIYGRAQMERHRVDRGEFRWIYYLRSKPRTHKVSVIFEKADVDRVFDEHIDPTAKAIHQAYASGCGGMDMQPDYRRCGDFGGCPHRERCSVNGSQIFTSLFEVVTMKETLLQRINNGGINPPEAQRSAPAPLVASAGSAPPLARPPVPAAAPAMPVMTQPPLARPAPVSAILQALQAHGGAPAAAPPPVAAPIAVAPPPQPPVAAPPPAASLLQMLGVPTPAPAVAAVVPPIAVAPPVAAPAPVAVSAPVAAPAASLLQMLGVSPPAAPQQTQMAFAPAPVAAPPPVTLTAPPVPPVAGAPSLLEMLQAAPAGDAAEPASVPAGATDFPFGAAAPLPTPGDLPPVPVPLEVFPRVYTLCINCRPVRPVVSHILAADIAEEANALVRAELGVEDYGLADYGKGRSALVVATRVLLQRKLDAGQIGPGDTVLLYTGDRMEADALESFMSFAERVYRS